MKPSSVPFWWVVRHRDGGYLGDWVDKHVQHQREAGRCSTREGAEFAAAWWEDAAHYVVKVHARIPEPKLPAWVKPVILGNERYLVGVRRVYPSEVTEYTFHVADSGALAAVDLWKHTPDGKRFCGGFTAAPPNVWAEAAQRAAKMLRARKAAR